MENPGYDIEAESNGDEREAEHVGHRGPAEGDRRHSWWR